ncbi:MAG TPA: response regulator transcription factor [Chitinophagaceae bacterium]|nr:response regulator transcription factor [Chitinophagaceae bacterium]
MIKIGIVDDKLSNRNILEDKLRRNKIFSVTFKSPDGEAFLEAMRQLQPEQLPDIVMMDLEMPVMDGVAAIATASSLYPGVKYVVLTVFDDEEKIFKAIKAGACGYLLKEESSDVITDMLTSLYESGAGPISPSIAYKILQMVQNQPSDKPVPGNEATGDMPNIFELSKREKEILQLLSRGLDYKEIGSGINISPNTVKKHTRNIYQKLHVNSKAQALRIAYLKGLL